MRAPDCSAATCEPRIGSSMVRPGDFDAPYAEDDTQLASELLALARLAPEREQTIDATARDLIGAIRGRGSGFGGVEEMLREYAALDQEGLALMVLAEALLHVPDPPPPTA